MGIYFLNSPHGLHGVGIDGSKAKITEAIRRKDSEKISNVEFLCKVLGKDYTLSERYDYSIASLFFHTIPRAESIYLLSKMMEMSQHVLICAFSRPDNFQQRSVLWLDQKLAGYYQSFRSYQKNGYFEGILSETSDANIEIYDTLIPFMKIYKIN